MAQKESPILKKISKIIPRKSSVSKKASTPEKSSIPQKTRSTRIRLHKSFRRSYREDYTRDLKAPGLMSHAVNTFKIIFKNWRLFLPLLLLIVTLDIILVGLLSEDAYLSFQDAIEETNASLSSGQLGNVGKAALTLIGAVSTGGFNSNMSDVQQVFVVILGLITWLVTIYLIRHLIAGNHPRLRDGLYNALSPIISTFCIVAVIFLEAIPIMIVIITYAAAINTDFLSTPFYALLYFVFAALLCLLSIYLISSSFLALIAVTAPGLYPLTALNTATDLVAGRRIRLIIRIFFALVVLAFCWIIVILPIILLDNLLKSSFEWLQGLPIVPFFLAIMTTFTFIYLSSYSYLFYRQLLDYNSEK